MIRTNHQSISFNRIPYQISNSRGKVFGILIIAALLAFELFNFSTTEFALNDLLGGLSFAGIRWAMILAIAFCGIDFAGIARLFTPQQSNGETKEVWYLFSAWLLAASMNAMLTWWGVSLAIVNHDSLGGRVVPRETLITIVPIFVAVMVWLIRVLIIGTFSVAGDRLYSQAKPVQKTQNAPSMTANPIPNHNTQAQPAGFHPIPKSSSQVNHGSMNRPEPTYHPAGMAGYNSVKVQKRK